MVLTISGKNATSAALTTLEVSPRPNQTMISRLEHDDERIEEIFDRPAERDGDAEREGQHRADHEADQRLGERDADMVEVECAGDAAIERGKDARRRRQDEGRHRQEPHQRFPDRERRGDQHEAQHEIHQSAGCPCHSMPPPALSAARMRRT
jgi:hypothetical protein